MSTSPPSVDKPDKDDALLISTVILTILGGAFVLTRLWVRFRKSKAYGWDDYFIAGALAASIVSMALTIAMCSHGYGKSSAKLSTASRIQASKFSNFALLINGFSMAFLKVSIGLSLLRLQLGRTMQWIIWGSIVLSVGCNALVAVGSLFACRPIEAIWNKTLDDFSCIPRSVNAANSYVQTGGNIVTDLFYSLGPIYYVSQVRVSVYNKWALRGVFLVGLSATVCAVAKCFELPKLKTSTDPTYDGVLITIWVRAELNAGLIAASIPPLKAVFEQVLRNVFHVRSGLHITSSGHMTPGRYRPSGYGGGSSGVGKAYGLHSFKQGGLSQHRTLDGGEDDDEGGDTFGANRGHAAYVVGGAGNRRSRDRSREQKSDGDSVEQDEDQKHILQASNRGRSGSSASDLAGDSSSGRGGGGDGWIVKTVDYSVTSEIGSPVGQAR